MREESGAKALGARRKMSESVHRSRSETDGSGIFMKGDEWCYQKENHMLKNKKKEHHFTLAIGSLPVLKYNKALEAAESN